MQWEGARLQAGIRLQCQVHTEAWGVVCADSGVPNLASVCEMGRVCVDKRATRPTLIPSFLRVHVKQCPLVEQDT